MSRTVRIVLAVVVVLALVGLVIPLIMRGRVSADRINCENHLKDLGLLGVRHAAPPGQGVPPRPRDELPPGTLVNPDLPADRRASWYTYMLTVLNEGPPDPDVKAKHRRPAGLPEPLAGFRPKEPWDSPANLPLATYRLATAICPAQVPAPTPGQPVTTNYVANGGLGADTPTRAPDEAGPKAGAYWYDGPTPDRLFTDGLQQTAQIIETNSNLGPWLQGGPATLRALDATAEPYLGRDRPFGGCHPGGALASMADGSVRFVKDTVDPTVFRAMLTRAGGPDELGIAGP